MAITFTSHAERKLLRLSKLGVTRNKVVETILKPNKVSLGYFGRKIAQSNLTPKLLLRVVFEERNNNILIITIYPGKGGDMMKISYDGEGDTLSILVHDGQIDHAEDYGLIIANFDENNSLIEIEILSASKVLGNFLTALIQAKPNAKLIEVEVK